MLAKSIREIVKKRIGIWPILGAIGLPYLLMFAGCTDREASVENTSLDVQPGYFLNGIQDVTTPSGLGGFRHETGAFGERWFPESMGPGCGFVDLDGDTYLDIVLVSGSTWPGKGDPPPVLTVYRNLGNGTFEDVTKTAGLDEIHAYGMGIAAADYDNDGDADLFVSTLGRDLLFNNERGVLLEVGIAAGIGDLDTWSMSTMWFDADRDGWLDLFVSGYVNWTPDSDIFCTIDGKTRTYCRPDLYEGQSPRFFRNNGDGSFTEHTEEAGFLPSPGKSLGVAEMDFDEDGWVDVLVSNDTQPDQLFHNQGDGFFQEVGLISGIAFDETGSARGGMGVDTGYLDETGEVSTVVANFAQEMIGVYRHINNGLFIDRAAISRIGRPSLLTLAFGLFLVDVDLDGDLDLFAANGHIHPEVEQTTEGITYRQAPHLFINDGRGQFTDRAADIGGPLAQQFVARGAACGDFDNDGDPDILVAENGGPAHLWRNDLNSGNFVKVTVRGSISNRDGIGARVTAFVDGVPLVRRVHSGSSYLSTSEMAVTFGLGTSSEVDRVEIVWPGGSVEEWSGIDGNQSVTLVEGTGRRIE